MALGFGNVWHGTNTQKSYSSGSQTTTPQSFSNSSYRGSGGSSKKNTKQSQAPKEPVFTTATPQSVAPPKEPSPAETSYKSVQTQNQFSRGMGNPLSSGVGIRGQIVYGFQEQEQRTQYIGAYEAGKAEQIRQQNIINTKSVQGGYTKSDYKNAGYKNFRNPSQIDRDIEIAKQKISSASIVGGQVSSSYLQEERRKQAENIQIKEQPTDFKVTDGFQFLNPAISSEKRTQIVTARNKAIDFYNTKADEQGGELSLSGTIGAVPKYFMNTPSELKTNFKSDLKNTIQGGKSTLSAGMGTTLRLTTPVLSVPTYVAQPKILIRENPAEVAGALAFSASSLVFPVATKAVGGAMAVGALALPIVSKNPSRTTGEIGESAIVFGGVTGATTGAVAGGRYVFEPRQIETFSPPSVSWNSATPKDMTISQGYSLGKQKYPSRFTEFTKNYNVPDRSFNIETPNPSLTLKKGVWQENKPSEINPPKILKNMGKRGELGDSRGRGGEFGNWQGTRPKEPDVFESAKPKDTTFDNLKPETRYKSDIFTEQRTSITGETQFNNPFNARITPIFGGSGGYRTSNFNNFIPRGGTFTGGLNTPNSQFTPSNPVPPDIITPPNYRPSDNLPVNTPFDTPFDGFGTNKIGGERYKPKFGGFLPVMPIRGGGFRGKSMSLGGKRVKKGYVPSIANIDSAFRIVKKGKAPKGSVSAFGSRAIYI